MELDLLVRRPLVRWIGGAPEAASFLGRRELVGKREEGARGRHGPWETEEGNDLVGRRE
jgi:hypothetical protein